MDGRGFGFGRSKDEFVNNALCSCQEDEICATCRFCQTRNTTAGRKSLGERIPEFLVSKSFYQNALALALQKLFPDKLVYHDEKDICTMLFEAVLFEDISSGVTPLAYFVENAPLAEDEKRLYQAWRTNTRYGFFLVEKVMPGKELQVSSLHGGQRHRLLEIKASSSIKTGSVIIARIVPFLKDWMNHYGDSVVLPWQRARKA